MNSCSDDIIEEILSRLPAKSLVRFKCVSKQWITLIYNPRFARANLHHHIHDNYSIFFKRERNAAAMVDDSAIQQKKYGWFYKFDPKHTDFLPKKIRRSHLDDDTLVRPGRICWFPHYSFFVMLACCDGMLCGFVCKKDSDDPAAMVLWNPTINECKTLPFPPVNYRCYDVGMSYDSSIHDYKIVLIPYESDGSRKAYVLTLKSNSWRVICSDFPYKIRRYEKAQSMSVNGKLYWAALDDEDEDDDDEGEEENPKKIIIEFDLASEKFSRVAMPEAAYGKLMNIWSLDGCLSLFTITDPQPTAGFRSRRSELWVMNKEETWVKLSSFYCDTHAFNPLYFTKTGELVVHFSFQFHCIYDQKLDSYKMFKVPMTEATNPVMGYYATLVSPLRYS